MPTLFTFNFISIAVVALLLWVVKKYIKKEKWQNLLLISASVGTVLLHYSMFFYHCFKGTGIWYLSENPNLLIPIYPCNIVMWSAVIFAFLKNKNSKLGQFLGDYIFWFGLISALVGMFLNVDFMENPTFLDFEITKSVLAHVTLLFNLLLIPVFGFIKIDMRRNMRHIIYCIILMLIVGVYCNTVLEAIGSRALAYDKNSMFLLHSPFEGVDFLTYPVIALIAIPIYFGLFAVCDLFAFKRGERFYNRFGSYCKEKFGTKKL